MLHVIFLFIFIIRNPFTIWVGGYYFLSCLLKINEPLSSLYFVVAWCNVNLLFNICLQEFVTCDHWMHLDIAGVMENKDEVPYLGKGMSGRPTRTVAHFAELLALGEGGI